MDKKTLLHLCVYALFCLLPGFALAAPQTGWWWNPNESGRGFFVESHDGLTFIGAYLYDDDGHAKWVIAGGPNADPYNFSGDLIYKTTGQTLFGNSVAPGDAITVQFFAQKGTLLVHGVTTSKYPTGTAPPAPAKKK